MSRKVFEEWDEVKTQTLEEITANLRPNVRKLCPPVLRALDALQVPQALIADVLKTKQPRISLFRNCQAQMSITEQERLCDVAEALIEKSKRELPYFFNTLEGLTEMGIPFKNPTEKEIVEDTVRTNIELAEVMTDIQRAIIRKMKGEKDDGRGYNEKNHRPGWFFV